MYHDLLIRKFSMWAGILTVAVSSMGEDEVVSTLVDDNLSSLDMIFVESIEDEPPVIIREQAIQQVSLPSVATKTTQSPENKKRLRPIVDSISGAEIRSYQRYGIADIANQTAGLTVVQTGQAGSQSSLFIRGHESNHTVVLLNGRRLPPGLAGLYQLEFLDVSTLESVQILKGGASSLYGADALAGAIDFQSTDARFVQSNSISSYFEGGSFSTFRTGHKITVRDGAVGMALDASYHDTDNDREFSAFENGTIRGNFAVELGDGVFFDILGYVQDSYLEVPGSSLSPTFPESQINMNQSGLFSPRFSIKRDDWDFSVFYSYTTNELEATQDVFFLDNLLEQNGHEAEAVFHYHPDDSATYSVGGGYYQYGFDRTPLIPGPFNLPSEFEYSYSSIFAQADIDLPANFHLLTSGRYDDHDTFESKGTYTVQLSHEIEPTGTTIFGKTSTGYKAPSGQDFIFLAAGLDPATLSPEESQSWELGVKQEVFNERSSVGVTYFHTDIENLVDADPFTFVDPAIVDTETQGIETELVVSPCEGLRLYANYTWLDAIITDGAYLSGFGGLPGDRLPRRPEHTLSGGFLVTGDNWKVGAEISGAYERLDSPGFYLDDYTVARLFGSVRPCEKVELYGRIENIFDLDYETTSGYEASGLGAFGGVRIVIGD